MYRVAIFTSVPPKLSRICDGADVGAEYQEHCIQSWLATRWPIYSVNPPSEIAVLRERWPQLNYLEIPEPTSAARAPKVCQIVDAMKAVGVDVSVFVNGDVGIHPRSGLVERLETRGVEGLLMGHRIELEKFNPPKLGLNDGGFDLFVFGRDLIDAYDERDFHLGWPWWDYWVPLFALFRDIPAFRFANSPIYHLAHPAVWGDRYAGVFPTFLRRMDELLSRDLSRSLEPTRRLAAFMRERIALLPTLRDDDERLKRVGLLMNSALISEDYFPLV